MIARTPTDAALRTMLRALASLQVLDDDRRSTGCVAPDGGGRGAPDHDARRVAQVSDGRLSLAREVTHRIAEVDDAMARATLLGLVEVAHCEWTAEALALHLAGATGPATLRAAVEASAARLNAATVALSGASVAAAVHSSGRGRSRLSPEAIHAGAVRRAAETTRDACAAEESRAVGALRAWGMMRLVAAVDAWEATR